MINTMQTATIISLDTRRERGRRVARAIDVRRGLEGSERRKRGRRGGRAWVNGHEVGEPRETLAHLSAIHD
jgi:hypothetical protein